MSRRPKPVAPPGGHDWGGLYEGFTTAFGVPGLVMSGSFIGFGALAASSPFGLDHAILATITIWALPAQVIMVNMLKHGTPLLALALAVSLTSIRLMPMVVSLLPRARMQETPRWAEFLAAHFIAVTVWILAFLNFERIARPRRLPFIIGLGFTLMAGMIVMTAIGYALVHTLPTPAAAGLVFLTPSFFFLSLFAGARRRSDFAAIAAGVILGPIALQLAPGFDLMIAGLVGGTAAWAYGRRHDGAPDDE
ncbi:MAG: AzlC family protein [Hyphomicrobiales bacterium]|nr:MAG: AzlC family protein [Hyphomicrobiales bacterium]